MRAGIIFTGTGPVLILTTYESFKDPQLISKLGAKGIKKYIAAELPLEKVKERYGNHYNVVIGDLNQTDDLRVLDYNGYNVFHSFSFSEMGEPIYIEPRWGKEDELSEGVGKVGRKGVSIMPTYIVLVNMTQKGMESIKESPARLEAAKGAFKALGGELKA